MYSTGIAYLLWLLGGCGALGFHRFYLRKIPTGLLWLFSGGLAMVGSIYDFFTLGRQVREANELAAQEHARLSGSNTYILPQGSHIVVNGDNVNRSEPAKVKETIEKVILRTAKKNSGIVTPGEIAIESDYSADDAKKALEVMVNKGFCEMRVRQSGVIVYYFPEFVKSDGDVEPLL